MVGCLDWYMDGTFAVTSPLFNQLYTIRGKLTDLALHVTFILIGWCDFFLTLKEDDTKCFSRSCMFWRAIEPHKRTEQFSKNWKRQNLYWILNESWWILKWPLWTRSRPVLHTALKGCYFHFFQSIYRHVQAYGMQTQYGTNINVAPHIRFIAALALVRPKDVFKLYNALKEFAFFKTNLKSSSDNGMKKLLKYVEKTWMLDWI